MAKTGDKGGQCVAYVRNYFGIPATGIPYAKNYWTTPEKFKRLNGPKTGCIAVWDGSSSNGNAGHVGVVEKMTGTGSSAKFTFSDSNRKPPNKELVEVLSDISQSTMEGVLTKFLGYVSYIKPKA